MSNREHLKLLKQGAGAWNRWRSENPTIRPDLRRAYLGGIPLTGLNLRSVKFWEADFDGTDLSDAECIDNAELDGAALFESDLSGASFRNASFHSADLRHCACAGTDFGGAELTGANFTGARLMGACLKGADLTFTNFSDANLANVDFSRSEMGLTIFGNNDLSTVKGLESVTHSFSSIIGIEAIYRSKGLIPTLFLKGAGLPDNFIEYMHSLTKTAFEFYSCFISYSSYDQRFAERLYADLQAKGVRCWYFPENAKWGEPVWGEIDRSIKIYDKLVVICSARSLQSGPVNREIERALQREDKEHRPILFPIRIDDYLFKKWVHPRKADVLSKVVGDFRNWNKFRAYTEAFNRLLSNLKSEAKATGES